MDTDALRQLGAVLLVLALLGAALWAFRHAGWYRPGIVGPAVSRGKGAGKAGRPRSLEALDRLTLTPQHSIHVVSVEGRRLLVAIHPQGCTLLVDFGLVDSGLVASGLVASGRVDSELVDFAPVGFRTAQAPKAKEEPAA